MESRGGDFKETKFFGLFYIIEKYLREVEFSSEDILAANSFYKSHGVPFNLSGWSSLYTKYPQGRLPIKIFSVRENAVYPTGTPLVVCQATDEEFFWLPSWIETMLMRVWYPTTVATISYHARKKILESLERTCENPEKEIDFKLHDFGSRGVSSQESAMLGGAAHLLNFKGSDTVVGIRFLQQYYPMTYGGVVPGYSIPAAEHSTITSWGRDNEVDAYRNMLTQFSEYPVMAVVSDSYNIYDACENLWGGELKEAVDKYTGTLVIRPDSGEPVEVVLKCLEILAEKFGTTTNQKGFKVLKQVRVIQGDGLDLEKIGEILFAIEEKGFSTENVSYGMGGGLLQKCNRDTLKFAYKCSAINRGGVWQDVYKDPIDDTGKKSKRGRINTENMVRVY